jgi:pimeloyl-ACP methyl ester carboxylesterase
MKKKFKTILFTTLVFSMLLSIAPAIAETAVTSRGNASGMGYTQTNGNLGGANYVIRIPDTWNGVLIVGCHAYFTNRDPNQELQFDSLAAIFISQGYGYASSDYGAQGYCVNAGVNATYQLTQYVINNYNVTGKVYIFGGSMGGEIALLLGEKYPNIYSGVLDMCGPKNLVTMYNDGSYLAGASLEQIRQFYGWPASAPADSTVQFFKDYATTAGIDLVAETGGSPTTAPQVYEKISPINHVNISIPVISLVGNKDYIVPLSQTEAYQSAITAAGHSDLYKMITVPGGGHIDTITLAQAPTALAQLIPGSSPTPPATPTPVPQPTATPTSAPTAAPAPTSAPTASPKHTPTATPKPSPTNDPPVTSTPTLAPASANDPTATPTIPELSTLAIIMLLFAVTAVLLVATKRLGGKKTSVTLPFSILK